MAVPLLLFKLTITPVLIAALTLAARRWGHGVAGLLVGLPLTSGPVSVFLAIEQGADFAQAAAAGTIGGIIAVGAYILAYAHTAVRARWPPSLAAGLAGFLLLAPVLAIQNPALVPVAILCTMVLVGTYLVLPKARPVQSAGAAPRWDLPVRMAVATGLTVVLTAAAGTLGPAWTGVLSPFPVFTAVLGAFTHRHDGSAAVIALLKGLVTGLFSFVAFFLVVGLTLDTLPLAGAYAAGAVAAIATNGAAWVLAHRRPTTAEAQAAPE